MTAVERALRHLEKYLAAHRQRLTSAKATPLSSRGLRLRPEPTQADVRTFPDITRIYESLPEVFGPSK